LTLLSLWQSLGSQRGVIFHLAIIIVICYLDFQELFCCVIFLYLFGAKKFRQEEIEVLEKAKHEVEKNDFRRQLVMVAKDNHLVLKHLESINSTIFDKFQKQISQFIDGQYGVYALYKNRKLYYVGKASNLKRRIGQHLKDKHAQKWNKFSLYILQSEEHIPEIEALIIRIADPKGNISKGKLAGSKNLQKTIKASIEKEQKLLVENLFSISGGARKAGSKITVKTPKKTNNSKKPLKGLFNSRKPIYANYKNKTYRADIWQSGVVKFDGKEYSSLTAAAKEIVDSPTINGWVFWKYKNANGKLVSLKTLRKQD